MLFASVLGPADVDTNRQDHPVQHDGAATKPVLNGRGPASDATGAPARTTVR